MCFMPIDANEFRFFVERLDELESRGGRKSTRQQTGMHDLHSPILTKHRKFKKWYAAGTQTIKRSKIQRYLCSTLPSPTVATSMGGSKEL